VQVKRSLADSKAVSMLSQSMVVAEAESRRNHTGPERRLQGRAAGSPTRGTQKVGGGDTAKQGGAEEGDDSLEAVVPGAGAEAGVGQRMMSVGLEEEVGCDDTVEESGAEGGSCDLEEAVQLSTVQEGTWAEAVGEAGQLMVGQQAEVGSDPEGKGAVREGFWIGTWDFTAQVKNMRRQRERQVS
jgi:hypothetical protein